MEKETVAFTKCCIQFDNNEHGIYSSGDTVSGIVNLTLKEAKKYKGVILRVKGWSSVDWNTRVNNTTIRYTGKEVYFKTYHDLMRLGDGFADSGVQYTPGLHKFYFSFTLARNLPCSYHGTYGDTRYEIKVTVKQPYKSDSCYRANFKVISWVDLNHIAEAKIPISISKSKKYYFLFSKKGLFNITVEVPSSGFICEDVIQTKCIINNQSKIIMEQVYVSLIRKIQFFASSPLKSEKKQSKIIASKSGGLVEKMKEEIKIISVSVPPLPLSSLNYCSIIRIRYFLKVKVKMEGIYDDIKFKFPIAIGSIPLRNQTNHEIDLSVPAQYDASQPTTSISYSNRSLTRIDEPPSYEEAMMSGPS